MAENNKRETVFQKLSNIFSNTSNAIVSKTNQTVGIDRDILRTTDKVEYEVKKLEKQQHSYLKLLWNKANSFITNQILQNEARRIPSYYDYEKM